MKEWKTIDGEKLRPMKRDEYFPAEPGVLPKELRKTEKKPDQPEKEMTKRVCAKCGKILGETEAVGGGETHGLCSECVKSYFWKKEDE